MALPTIVAPPGTPCFLADGHGIEEDSVFAQVKFTTGHSRARRVWTVPERVVPVAWALDEDRLVGVDNWYESVLLAGTREWSARVRSQSAGAPLLWWRARWINYQCRRRQLGRGGVISGSVLLTGEGSETGPDLGVLAMEIDVALVDVRSNVSVPKHLAMEISIALVQPRVLRMEILVALLSVHESADSRSTEDNQIRDTEDGVQRQTELG